MKNLLPLIALLFSVFGFSQAISVNTSNYTVPQLVNNVLINSPCVSATNITWRTGTNFGSSNGIGFFQNTNENFPMQSGVILSTGNVLNAAGPNTSMLNDGSSSWIGDSSLEATLAAVGIPMTSTNASVLEFDFTPISPNFSFDFVFASEEYGNFQCQYSDAFAFLLTNVNTGVTTNLAVIPNTNLPISVVTIRDFLYNSSCGSANAQYFGSFNGGSNAANSATNFNGQTQVLTAASSLTPGVPYHIKLVIADRLDPQSDSSIFISSDSFNIGQDVLGLDLTAANNTALCFGTNYTINSNLNASDYTFVWKKNGVVVSGQTGPTLNITQPGTYSVTYSDSVGNCIPITDSVIIQYLPQMVTANPKNLYKCDTGSGSYTYNLASNSSLLLVGANSNNQVSYFTSLSDANSNINSIATTYQSAGNQTIYVRIQNPTTGCHIVKSFQLLLAPPPVAIQPDAMKRCENIYGSGIATFNLNTQKAVILGAQSATIYTVTFFTSLNNATNAVNQIFNLQYNSVSTTIYARVFNASDPSCFSITSFNLIVDPKPLVDTLQDVIVCGNYTLLPLTNGNYFSGLNGTGTMMNAGDVITQTQTIYIFNQPGGPNTCSSNSQFQVTIIEPGSMEPSDVTSCGSYTLPSLQFGKYYTAPGGTGTIIPAGTVIATSQVVYFYYITPVAPFCVVDSDFNVTIVPTIEVGTRPNVFDCTSYILPSLTIGNYFTAPGGTGTQIAAGTAITISQTIYVYASTSGSTPCSDEDSFEVFIGINAPSDVSQCNGYTLPQLPIGNYYTAPMGTGQLIPSGTVINQSAVVYIYVPLNGTSTTNCTDNLSFSLSISQPPVDTIADQTVCENYILPTLTHGQYFTGIDGTGTMLSAGESIETTQTIYIRSVLNPTCANQTSFTVTILGLPQIDSRSEIDICDMYVLTPLSVGNYYTGPNGTGTLLTGGSVITTSQLIYIYAISTGTPACSAQNSFQINIFSAQADTLPNVTICDSYILPTLSANNKYFTQSGGLNGGGTQLYPGAVITTSQTIYIFKENVIRTSFSCFYETSFTVTVNYTPIVLQMANQTACNSYTLPSLAVGNYFTGPNGSGTQLNAGDVLMAAMQTIYVFAQTNTTPNCTNETSFTVTIFNVDDKPSVTTCVSYTLPVLTIGKYYTATNGTGNMLPAGTVISTSQTIYIYAVAPFTPSCSDESSFTVTIIPAPVANNVPVALRTVCDEDGTNDGIVAFNLQSLSAAILGTQIGTEFNIAYFESIANANTATNPVTTTTLSQVYVRVSNSLATNCFDVKPITIIVNKLPEPTPADGIICIDSKTGTLLNPYTIVSGLNSGTHTFLWTNSNGDQVGTGSSYTAILPGVYTVVATRIATGCSSAPVNVTVSPSEPAIIAYTVSEDFAEVQSVTVVATGVGGNYEYQLDNGDFQDSPVFNNVTSGIHMITVRDKNGCGSSTAQALVINYPKFFTPNGDGYNDTWNIRDLSHQPTAVIFIYDRFGKLMRQIKPSGEGWDGTFNGSTMPSTDYWFTVTYTDENQVGQEFRAHFAMKR